MNKRAYEVELLGHQDPPVEAGVEHHHGGQPVDAEDDIGDGTHGRGHGDAIDHSGLVGTQHQLMEAYPGFRIAALARELAGHAHMDSRVPRQTGDAEQLGGRAQYRHRLRAGGEHRRANQGSPGRFAEEAIRVDEVDTFVQADPAPVPAHGPDAPFAETGLTALGCGDHTGLSGGDHPHDNDRIHTARCCPAALLVERPL
jgi:hypothetical protein